MTDQNTTSLFKEAFIEHSCGWRWRFATTDEGQFSIEYQERDETANGGWVTRDDNRIDGLWASARDQIIEAIKTVCETAG